MVSGEPDFQGRFKGTIDHWYIKGVTLLNPTIAACLPTSIENPAIAYDTVNDRFKVDIKAWSAPTQTVDVTDRWARQLGAIDLARVLGAALSHANPVITRLTDGSAFIDPRDVSDRAARLLGIVYGSQAQQILQRATTFDLIAQLRHQGVEIDPRAIRALTSSDVVTANNLLNPHPVTQTTRTNLLTKPEREDLTILGGTASPNNAGVQLIAGAGGQKIKVYDAGFHGAVDGLHYFYFGTSTTPTTKRFCTANLKGLVHKTFVQPRVGADGDSLYLFASVSETNMPYDVGYVKE